MKFILIIGIIISIIIGVVIILEFSGIGERIRTPEPWNVSDVDGAWGTEIIVEYEDGSTDNLNGPLPSLSVFFRDKKVDNFKYILSSKGTSDIYDSIEIDMSGFVVLTTITDQEDTEWGRETVSNDVISLDMDGEWNDVYIVQVDASSLEILDVGGIYNLSFTPSGSIVYRSSLEDIWADVPIPDWFYLRFSVNEDEDEEDRWIQVELSSEL